MADWRNIKSTVVNVTTLRFNDGTTMTTAATGGELGPAGPARFNSIQIPIEKEAPKDPLYVFDY